MVVRLISKNVIRNYILSDKNAANHCIFVT